MFFRAQTPNTHYSNAIMRKRVAASAAFVLALLLASNAHTAGLKKATIPASGDQKALEVTLWTPCAQPVQTPLPAGPFALRAIPGCPVVGNSKLPLIVMSHGRGGSALGHHDTAEALADTGFVVASFNHPGDNAFDLSRSDDISTLYQRPNHVKRVIDFMLSPQSPYAQRIDVSRIGLWGFSRGGYTGLVLANATPGFAQTQLPCPDTKMKICQQLAQHNTDMHSLVRDPRIQAMVLVDPLSFFPHDGKFAIRPSSHADMELPTWWRWRNTA
jgi:predicted dienelactone hydrolase